MASVYRAVAKAKDAPPVPRTGVERFFFAPPVPRTGGGYFPKIKLNKAGSVKSIWSNSI